MDNLILVYNFQLGFFGRVKGVDEPFGDIAVDKISVVSGSCEQPPKALFSCSFEDVSGPMCGMEQDKHGDEFHWTRHSGPTTSSETGPDKAKDGDYYILYWSSDPRKQGDTAM